MGAGLVSWMIIEILLNGFEAWIIISFLANYFGIKENNTNAVAISATLSTLLISTLKNITIFASWATAVYILLIFVLSLIFFKGKAFQKIIVLLVFIVSIIFIDTITTNLFAIASRIPVSSLLEKGPNRIICIIISKTLLFIISTSITKLLSKDSSKFFLDYWINMIIVPIISFIIAIFVLEYNLKYMVNNTETTMLTFMCSGILIINIVSLYLFEKGIKDRDKVLGYQLMEQQMDLLQKYVKEAEETQREISGIWHDFRNHLTTLSILLETNNTKEAIIYLNDLTEQNSNLKFKVNTGNVTVDALLNQKCKVAQNANININVDAKIPKDISISSFDICVVLSNSVDNAIEACVKIENTDEKFISIKIYTHQGYLFFKIINSIKENSVTTNADLISKKIDKKYHGIGIGNIKKIVGKYDGEIEFGFENNKFMLTLMLKNA